jgi:hypothetical protein
MLSRNGLAKHRKPKEIAAVKNKIMHCGETILIRTYRYKTSRNVITMIGNSG